MKRSHDQLDASAGDEDGQSGAKRQNTARVCPYLDTVDRNLLDFDFEKVCSVTLSAVNVYCCLVCGKYFQGRAVGTPAFTHSLQAKHHVLIHTGTKKCYCLPDNYEILDSVLDDVKNFLDPLLTGAEIQSLDSKLITSRTLDGRSYICGVIGLNNTNKNDHLNTVLQALVHLPFFRNFWLTPSNYIQDSGRAPTELVGRFGMLVRKIWNPHNYRNHVTPHEFLQDLTMRSERKFRSGVHGDPIDFISWLLNTLHKDFTTSPITADMTPEQILQAKKKAAKDSQRPSIITDAFQGKVRITSEKEFTVRSKQQPKKQPPKDDEDDGDDKFAPRMRGAPEKAAPEKKEPEAQTKTITTTTETPFFYLSLEAPTMPLFKDEQERNIIPQRPLPDLLAKFDGKTPTFMPALGETRRMTITQLPRYLILHIKRFSKNIFFSEKNKTIINFPVKNLDLKDYVTLPPGSTVSTRYDLIANIRHEGSIEDTKETIKNEGLNEESTFAVHILHKANNQWYNMHDVIVEETMHELIPLSEAYIQIYERQA